MSAESAAKIGIDERKKIGYIGANQMPDFKEEFR